MEVPSKFSMLSTRSSNTCCSVPPKDSMPWMSESSVLSIMAGLAVVAALVFLVVAVCSAGLVPALVVGLPGLAPGCGCGGRITRTSACIGGRITRTSTCACGCGSQITRTSACTGCWITRTSASACGWGGQISVAVNLSLGRWRCWG